MLCNNCNVKSDCGWYQSLEKIKTEIILGIGTNDKLGHDLMEVINDFEMNECEYYEE